ncbi:MAG: alpha/beta fold hydrolase [Pikeienuella sp.]
MSGPSGAGSGGGSSQGEAGLADLLRRSVRFAAAIARVSETPIQIATTPKAEVWRDGKVSLHRYHLETAPQLGPLLILHGLFGRQTITDLGPRRSLVRRLLDRGTDLWVLDWGSPSRADSYLDFTDYAIDWLGEAIDQVTAATGRAPSLIGICQGGVFALCHAALFPQRVAGLALAVTPVDFHADAADANPEHGVLNLWMRELPPPLVEAFLDERGGIPGAMAGAAFQSVLPPRMQRLKGPELLELADDPDALDLYLRMETWLSDRPDHPAGAARQWLLDLYRENALIRDAFVLDGRPVRLSEIRCPVLNIVAAQDHLVPPSCARGIEGHVPEASYKLLEIPTGHIGVFVSEKARDLVAPAIIDWLHHVRAAQNGRAE